MGYVVCGFLFLLTLGSFLSTGQDTQMETATVIEPTIPGMWEEHGPASLENYIMNMSSVKSDEDNVLVETEDPEEIFMVSISYLDNNAWDAKKFETRAKERTLAIFKEMYGEPNSLNPKVTWVHFYAMDPYAESEDSKEVICLLEYCMMDLYASKIHNWDTIKSNDLENMCNDQLNDFFIDPLLEKELQAN